ncbi:MAG TPA: L-threonylcarbamoyladenylate synthase [Patescibacteria group bacterium]|nr:L-threonylcarbamoyladenylate synthase [Patescibacteria group bacterium]
MNDIKNAAEILKSGGVGIFPTDTAFALGCRIDNEKAVERLFSLKHRSENHAVPVLVSGIEMAKKYVVGINEEVTQLINRYWPGGLTLVLVANEEKVPLLVRGQGQTVGVREPNHEIARQLIEEVGVPLIGTSANFHGKPTAYSFDALDKELIEKVDFALEGECKLGIVSTVLDCSQSPWKIIRQGALEINV